MFSFYIFEQILCTRWQISLDYVTFRFDVGPTTHGLVIYVIHNIYVICKSVGDVAQQTDFTCSWSGVELSSAFAIGLHRRKLISNL